MQKTISEQERKIVAIAKDFAMAQWLTDYEIGYDEFINLPEKEAIKKVEVWEQVENQPIQSIQKLIVEQYELYMSFANKILKIK